MPQNIHGLMYLRDRQSCMNGLSFCKTTSQAKNKETNSMQAIHKQEFTPSLLIKYHIPNGFYSGYCVLSRNQWPQITEV